MANNITQVDYILTLHEGINNSIEDAKNRPIGEEDQVQLFNMYNNSTIMASTPLTIPGATQNSSVLSLTGISTTTSYPTTEPVTFPQDHNMGPLGLLTILILAVIGNITVCLVVRIDRHLHHMTYYFFVSLAVVHLLMVAVVMPPAVLVILAGEFHYNEELCKMWTTLDLFFCNNMCLHLAFTNMDAFLRLKDPLRHGRVTTTTCSIVLWIGAPWGISTVQGIAQFMLSQGDHNVIQRGICFIADKNFVILGTLFSFLIPTVISILFYSLCVFEIRALKHGKFLDESDASAHNIYRYASNESIPEDMSDTTSCVSDTTEQLPREQVQLAVVQNMKEGEIKECFTDSTGQDAAGQEEEMTSFCDESTPNGVTMIDPINSSQTANFADHILSADQSTSCTLLLRDPSTEGLSEPVSRPNAEVDHSSPDENLRHEQAISRLMFVMLICYFSLWIPFSVSNVVYGICVHCRHNMSLDEMNTFRWLAYSTCMLGPFIYGKFCEPIRQAYWNLLTCKYCFQSS